MSEQKRYTAQEMRKASSKTTVLSTTNRPDVESWIVEAMAMLRQAADAEEELANLKTTSGELEKRALEYADHGVSSPLLTNTIKRLIAERNSLKERLEAVVKECGEAKWDPDNWLVSVRDAACTHNKYIDRILRAARGESDSSNSSSYTDDIYNS